LNGFCGFGSNAGHGARLAECGSASEAFVSLNDSVSVPKTAPFSGFSRTAFARQTCLSKTKCGNVAENRKIQQLWAANASCCGLLVLSAPAGLCLSTRESYQSRLDIRCPSERKTASNTYANCGRRFRRLLCHQ
jgi:hypothetical protein